MEKQFKTMIGLKYEIRGNVYEIVGIANNIVQLQSINDDYHMEITYERFCDTIKNRIAEIEHLLDDDSTTDEDEIKKITRWQKIAESAAKQSGRNAIPEIKNIVNIEKINQLIKEYDSVIVAYENEEENTIKHELLRLKEKVETNNKIKILPIMVIKA